MSGGGALRALWPAAPLLVWAAHFTALYAAHALACERGLGEGAARLAALVATAVALAALLALAWPALPLLRHGGGEAAAPFARWFAGAAAVLAAVAVVFGAAAALVVPACA